ncbi:MAG TPA: Uma2 family endonuclease [Thermoanaerobaculia bacterium]|nr:Uma2 family endonuclease [Thermoanaerobaculia bacterium]
MSVPVPKVPADWELTPAPEDADPYRYGWRPKYVRLVGGRVEEQRIPLTAADLLDPQLGDEMVQGGPHAKLSHRLFGVLDMFYEEDTEVLVTWDMKMLWGIPGLKEPAPDIAVIRGVRDRDEPREVFDVVREGVRPCLVIEVVSPKYEEIRRNDYVEKKEIYRRAGIPEYLIVEPLRARKNPIRQWTGYRLDSAGQYQRIEPDSDGRLLSETTGLLFGIAGDRSFLVVDSRTGEPLLDLSQIEAARKAAEESRESAEQARKVAEESRKVAEESREAAEEARKVAEAEVARLRAELDQRRADRH